MTALLVDNAPHGGPCPELVPVPREIATCPECGGQLHLQASVWETDSGSLIRGEIEVDCANDNEPDDEGYEDRGHRWWQGEWQPVIDRVTRWAFAHVRVAPKEAS